MLGDVTLSVHDGVVVRRLSTRPAAVPRRPPHRRHSGAAGGDGHGGFAEAARVLLPTPVVSRRGRLFAAPLKFYRDEPRTLSVQRGRAAGGDEWLVAACRLTAERLLPGRDPPQRTVHFTGTCASRRARRRRPAEPGRRAVDATLRAGVPFYFHGPAYQVCRAAWRAGDEAVTALANPLPAEPRSGGRALTRAAARRAVLPDRRLWKAGSEGQLALPIGRRPAAACVGRAPPTRRPARGRPRGRRRSTAGWSTATARGRPARWLPHDCAAVADPRRRRRRPARHVVGASREARERQRTDQPTRSHRERRGGGARPAGVAPKGTDARRHHHRARARRATRAVVRPRGGRGRRRRHRRTIDESSRP